MRTTSLFFLLAIIVTLIGCGGAPYNAPYANVPPPIDPCQPSYFQEWACQSALNAGGYYHYGRFYQYPMGYNRTVVIYRDQYNGWLSRGNRPTVIDFRAPEYSQSYRTPASSNTAAGSYRSPSTSGSYQPSVPATSGSYREPQPRDPVTGRFIPKNSAPPSTSYRGSPTPSANPTGSYQSSQTPGNTSSSYRSSPAPSTSMSSTRSTTSNNYSSGGSGRSTSTSSRSSSSSSSSSGSSRSSSSSSRR